MSKTKVEGEQLTALKAAVNGPLKVVRDVSPRTAGALVNKAFFVGKREKVEGSFLPETTVWFSITKQGRDWLYVNCPEMREAIYTKFGYGELNGGDTEPADEPDYEAYLAQQERETNERLDRAEREREISDSVGGADLTDADVEYIETGRTAPSPSPSADIQTLGEISFSRTEIKRPSGLTVVLDITLYQPEEVTFLHFTERATNRRGVIVTPKDGAYNELQITPDSKIPFTPDQLESLALMQLNVMVAEQFAALRGRISVHSVSVI